MYLTNLQKLVQYHWLNCGKSKIHYKHLFNPLSKYTILTLLLAFTIFLPSTFAQDYTRWDLPEGAKLRIGKGSVQNITFSPDGSQLFVESSIGIWTYDAHIGVELDFIAESPSNFLGFRPDTKTFIHKDSDNTVTVRDFSDGKIKITLQGNTEDIRSFSCSPDGKTLASTSDNEIHLWDLTTGEKKATLLGHTNWIRPIAFSPDGATLASAGSDSTLRLWDVATASLKTILSEYEHDVRELVFSLDGNTLVSARNTIVVWDVNTREKINTIKTPSLYEIAISPDGNTIASGGFDGLFLWDIDTGTLKAELGGHLSGIRSIAFSPDGTIIACGGGDELFLWDTESYARKMALSGHTTAIYSMALNPDGSTLAIANREKIRLWDPTTAEFKTLLYVQDWSFNSSLDYSPDGNTLACQSGTWTLLWDVARGTHIATLSGYGGVRSNTSYGFASIVFSPDGQFLVGGHNYNTAVHLWSAGRTHTAAFIGHTDGIISVDLSYDARILASGSNDRTVRLWYVATATQINTLNGHTDRVHCVKFNPDATIVASGSKDKTIILWDVSTGERITTLTGHTDSVNTIAFSLTGNTIVSGAGWDDNQIRLWDVSTGKLKTTLTGHTSGVKEVIFSPDGSTLVSGGMDGMVLLWDFTSIIGTDIEVSQHAVDANRDGVVDLQDLIYVASQFGQSGVDNDADVNEDGVVNIEDILLVAAALEDGNAAPSRYSRYIEVLTAAQVQQWISQARQIHYNSLALKKGIAVLEQLLDLLIPKETVLLPNFPNPFNPETWIPYQLASSVDVTLDIYSANGHLVRTLKLGHQHAGIYQNRTRAVYWDGKNKLGELVASGIYFYTMSAGEFTATRRMVILK